MNKKRERVQNYLYDKLKRLEGGKTRNADRYKKLFSKMSDKDFDVWMNDLRAGKFKISIEVKNGFSGVLRLNDIFDTAHNVGCEIFEQLRLFDETTQRYYITPYKYCILELPIRRLKQYLLDKYSIPKSDKKINPVIGQVVGEDKGSSLGITEAQAVSSKNLFNSLAEFLIVRGGNLEAYANMRAQLIDNGECSLSSLNINSTKVKVAVAVRAYLNGLHLSNNL